MIFFLSREVAWFFFVLRGCVIFKVPLCCLFFLPKRLRDLFGPKGSTIFFLSFEVAWLSIVPRGSVIFCPGRIHDFCLQMLHYFFSSWKAAWFFCPERLRDFFVVPRGCVNFFVLRGCVIFFSWEVSGFFCPKMLRDICLSQDVAWFFCPERLHDFFVPRGCVIFYVKNPGRGSRGLFLGWLQHPEV